MNTFLNRKDVQGDLGVSKKWDSCTQIVHLLVSMYVDYQFVHNAVVIVHFSQSQSVMTTSGQ